MTDDQLDKLEGLANEVPKLIAELRAYRKAYEEQLKVGLELCKRRNHEISLLIPVINAAKKWQGSDSNNKLAAEMALNASVLMLLAAQKESK